LLPSAKLSGGGGKKRIFPPHRCGAEALVR
jgi:hypothetical protein